jgi:hypothetical protein
MKQGTGFCPHCSRRVLTVKERTNHLLHLFISFFTLFMWMPIWIIIGLVNLHRDPRCGVCGTVTPDRGLILENQAR